MSRVTGVPVKFTSYPLGMRAGQIPGVRPAIRRDQRPTCTDAINWATPRPAEHLVPVLWTAADLATIRDAVAAQRDRFAEAATEAEAGATGPDRPTEPAGDGFINIEPNRAGYARIAARFRAEAARYDRLAKRLNALTPTVGDTDDL